MDLKYFGSSFKTRITHVMLLFLFHVQHAMFADPLCSGTFTLRFFDESSCIVFPSSKLQSRLRKLSIWGIDKLQEPVVFAFCTQHYGNWCHFRRLMEGMRTNE